MSKVDNKKRSAIRVLESQARKGDVKALYQLAMNYSEGKFVDKNIELSSEYLSKSLAIFKDQNLNVSEIKIFDFRVFKEIKIDFCTATDQRFSNLTVIVGGNGAGKTTILEAIAKSLSWLTNRVLGKEGGRSLELTDIHNDESVEYSSIVTKLSVLKNLDYEIVLSKAKEGSNTSRRNSIEDVHKLALLYREINSSYEDFNLPVMAYYSVTRAVEVNKKDMSEIESNSNIEMFEKFSGYNLALNGSSDFRLFFRWFKFLEDIRNSPESVNDDSDELMKLNEQIAWLENLHKDSSGSVENSDFILSKLNEIENKINSLKISKKKYPLDSNKIIQHVTNAIYKFMPGFENLRIKRIPFLDLVVEKNGLELSVLQLSQGERSLIALISDIARRLVLLNPSLDNPLDGKGVVLIDEIDLHLHPEWQQAVLPNLLYTFPNIQFIVTTHSPQVLSTVAKESIRKLGNNVEGKNVASIPKSYSYGMPSNDVMEAVMHVNPQPPIPERQLLNEITSLVDQGNFESSYVQEKLPILKHALSDKHPQILKIERSIRRQKVLNR